MLYFKDIQANRIQPDYLTDDDASQIRSIVEHCELDIDETLIRHDFDYPDWLLYPEGFGQPH